MCTLPICDNDDTIFIYYCTLSYYSTVEHPSLHYVSHHSPSRSGYSSVPYFSFLRLLCLSVCFPPTFTYTLKLLLLFLLWLFILIISIFLRFRTETPECLTFEYMTKWKFSLRSLFSPYICFVIDNFYRNVIVFSFCPPVVFFLLSFLLLWWWKINNRGTNKYAKTVLATLVVLEENTIINLLQTNIISFHRVFFYKWRRVVFHNFSRLVISL